METVVGIGFAVLCAAFSLIWWEVRQLRRSKHSAAQVLQWLVICVRILAKRSGVDLPDFLKDE